MGNGSRVITRHFPELSTDGDAIWVTIRNPMWMAPEELITKDSEAKVDPDTGEPVNDEEAKKGTYALLAKLIIGWRVYDATWVPKIDGETGEMMPGQEPPRLSLPATAAKARKLPFPIFQWLGEQLESLNPPTPTADPEDGTSKTS